MATRGRGHEAEGVWPREDPPAGSGINSVAGKAAPSVAEVASPAWWLFAPGMETQSEEQAVTKPADSGGEGGPPQVAGAQAARPEDRMTLLLRLFLSSDRPGRSLVGGWAESAPLPKMSRVRIKCRSLNGWWLEHSLKLLKPLSSSWKRGKMTAS